MALAGLSLSELRAIVFLDWRAIRHASCGFDPPSSEMVSVWELSTRFAAGFDDLFSAQIASSDAHHLLKNPLLHSKFT